MNSTEVILKDITKNTLKKNSHWQKQTHNKSSGPASTKASTKVKRQKLEDHM